MMASVSFQQLFLPGLILGVCLTGLLTRNYISRRLLLYKFRQIDSYLRDSEDVFYETPALPAMNGPFTLNLKKWQKDLHLINKFFIKCNSQILDNSSKENRVYFQNMKESLADCNLQVQKLLNDLQQEDETGTMHLGQFRRSFFLFSADFNRFNESFSH